ncbi:TRAP transporter large permease [Nitratireductor pacificus]|uniref:TRAP transporter large permease protein n=1 Tax=Nitratireductor pacificus pht-3B TaxID=391937 RepID=K2M9P8_9HYPH|nr:TRAP transporter large permease subunit [Nitratireductor pacificus]EKF18866.1 C4-dicarboxylate transporter family protein subunit DctM [Nitratireductor pacificus pht-3B]
MNDAYFWPILMLVGLMAGIFTGYPVAFVLAGIGLIFAFLGDVPVLFLSLGVSRIYSGILTNWLLIAIPLFVFMGLMLERSGVAQRLLRSLASVFRGLPGGYAFAVAIIGVVMAASTGIIGASVVLMGMMALPTMLKNGYDARISTGLIASSGTLGILIPPSIMLIVLGDQMRVSVGDLFMGAVGPGLLLGGLYLAYLIFVAIFQPHRMPAAPAEDNTEPLWRVAFALIRDLLAPIALIAAVLGTIVTGIATPTESAAIGAAGAMLLALLSGKLSLSVFADALRDTTKTTAMIIFVMIGATIFSVIFRKLGGDQMIVDAFALHGDNPYAVLLTIMLLVFVLGFFLEWVEITLVVVPIVAPIVAGLDFGMTPEQTLIWFAIALSVNLQTSFLTPPFGYALFYLRGIAPEGVSISTIYRGIIPFVVLQLLALTMVVLWPQITLWLPAYLSN